MRSPLSGGVPKSPSSNVNLKRLPTKYRQLLIQCSVQKHCDILVCGGGAAGLTAAYFAAQSGAKNVLILEKNKETGRKILISGGTRCNVLPASSDFIDSFWTESSRSALKAIFSSWSIESCQDWLSNPKEIGIQLALEEETSKLFPVSNDAKEVRNRLVAACQKRGVSVEYGYALTAIQPVIHNDTIDGYQVTTTSSNGIIAEVAAKKVILATGGKSFPSLGADGIGFGICQKQLGHSLHPTYPALTPLLGVHPGGHQLAGLSMYDVQLTVDGLQSTGKTKKRSGNRKKAREAYRTALLFTHRGYSGPAVLDLSHHVIMALERQQPPPVLKVNWVRDMNKNTWEDLFKEASSSTGTLLVATILKKHGIPSRLADALLEEADAPGYRIIAELRKAERLKLLECLCEYRLPITGHEGYGKAEVTGGGVPLEEIDCSTMESKMSSGVYLVGELVDVHGRIGGFNFLWAWFSGRLAGKSAAQSLVL